MENGPDALNPLEKEGVIQRFEYCFELAWKTMKDYLEEGGFVFAAVTPRLVAELHAQFAIRNFSEGGFAESAKLEQAITANLKGPRLCPLNPDKKKPWDLSVASG